MVLAPDLLDQSRISAAVEAAGKVVVLARSAEEVPRLLEDGADLVLADLSRPGVLGLLAALRGSPSVGFAPHVDAALLRRARRAGCTRVLARSAFFARLPELLAGLAERGTPGGEPAPTSR